MGLARTETAVKGKGCGGGVGRKGLYWKRGRAEWEMRGFVEESFGEIGGNLRTEGGKRVVAAGDWKKILSDH